MILLMPPGAFGRPSSSILQFRAVHTTLNRGINSFRHGTCIQDHRGAERRGRFGRRRWVLSSLTSYIARTKA